MYKLIEDNEKEKYQKIFVNIMKYKAVELGSRNIGDPSGNRSMDVYWSSKYEYWYATRDSHPTQYKNIFGLEMPTERDATMIGMINFTKKGWQAQVLIIENKDTKKSLLHIKEGYNVILEVKVKIE